MPSLEPLWIYILVPAVLVSLLILIRLKQVKTSNKPDITLPKQGEEEGTKASQRELAGENQTKPEKTQRNSPEVADKAKPKDCPNFLGYLYLKKAPDRSHIPNECYNCPRLLQCLYSPNVIEKVYG